MTGRTPLDERIAREDEEDRLGRILYLRERIVRDATPENVYRPHGRETLYGTAPYADPFTLDDNDRV